MYIWGHRQTLLAHTSKVQPNSFLCTAQSYCYESKCSFHFETRKWPKTIYYRLRTMQCIQNLRSWISANKMKINLFWTQDTLFSYWESLFHVIKYIHEKKSHYARANLPLVTPCWRFPRWLLRRQQVQLGHLRSGKFHGLYRLFSQWLQSEVSFLFIKSSPYL